MPKNSPNISTKESRTSVVGNKINVKRIPLFIERQKSIAKEVRVKNIINGNMPKTANPSA